MYNAEHFRLGNHLENLKAKTTVYSPKRSPWRMITQNTNPRYHYLKFDSDAGIVDSIVDFKQYFSVSLETIQANKVDNFIGSLNDLYREDVCQRFSSFLSRIGLPNPVSP